MPGTDSDMFPELKPDADDWDDDTEGETAPTMREAIDMHIGNTPAPGQVEIIKAERAYAKSGNMPTPAAPDVAAAQLEAVWEVLARHGMNKADVATPAAALKLLLSSIRATAISPEDWDELTAERDAYRVALEDMRRAELPRGMHHKSDVVAWVQMKAGTALKAGAK